MKKSYPDPYKEIAYIKKRLKCAYERRRYWSPNPSYAQNKFRVNKRNEGNIHFIREMIEDDICNLKLTLKELKSK